ncbi:MAG: CBS domain-containing protein [Candidatus Methanofastidiosia archaeon]
MDRDLKEISNKAICIDKDRRLSFAVELMEKHTISRLPVTEDGTLVGIITERDIVEKIGSSRSQNFRTSSFHISSGMTHDPFFLGENAKVIEALMTFKNNNFSGVPIVGEKLRIITKTDFIKHFDIPGYVSENLNTTFEILKPNDRVVHARRLLLEKDMSSIPVWDEKLVGIITIQDILFGINEFREQTPGKYMSKRLKEFKIEEIMTREVNIAKLDDKLNDVKKIMIKNNFSSMPVLDFENEIVGLISKDEMINVL